MIGQNAGVIRRALGVGGVLLFGIVGTACAAAPSGPRLALETLSRTAQRLAIETASQSGARRQAVVGGSKSTSEPLPEFGFAPSWSPDGKRLVFGGHAGGRPQLFVVAVSSGRVKAIPGTQGAFDPIFAPDGRMIAFARARVRAHIDLPNDHSPPKISSYASATTWMIELDGGNARRLTPWHNGLEITPSSFSPDGRSLAVSQFDEDSADFYAALVLRTDGSGSALLARDAARPAFSPDGRHVALIAYLAHSEPGSGRYGSYRGALTVMRADGTEPRLLARTTFGEQSPPSWDPSGERLAYTEGTSVMEINADGSCRQKVLAGTAKTSYYGPAWQPGPGREAGRIAC